MNIAMWFKGIRGKLLVSTFLPITAVGLMTWISFSINDDLGNRLDVVYDNMLPSQDAVGAMMETRMTIGYRIWSVIGSPDDLKYRETTLKSLEGSIEQFKKDIATYEAIPFLPGEAETYQPFKDILPKYLAMNDQIYADLKTNTPESMARVLFLVRGGEWQKTGSIARDTFNKLTDYYAANALRSDKEQAESRASADLWTTVIGLSSCFLLSLVLLYIAHSVAKSVGSISVKINEAGSQVTAAIEQLSAAGQSLSQSSTQAAASLEETVASLEEMTSMVSLNSESAKQAASLSVASRDSAERGQKEITSLVSSMQDISQSSRKIEEIINVIDDIAFQTNLLALNAAVEAARAGEQGRGFAVVADAVRTLAQRSADAAKDITHLIKDSGQKVQQGAAIAGKSGAVMSEIVTSVKKVADLAEEIATSSNEQKTGIQQISRAMNDLDSSSQGNAASSEEIASTAEEISSQSMQMQKMMEELTETINGRESGATVPAPKDHKVVALKASKRSAPAPVPAKPASGSSAADLLPFDEDEVADPKRGKIGSVSGF